MILTCLVGHVLSAGIPSWSVSVGFVRSAGVLRWLIEEVTFVWLFLSSWVIVKMLEGKSSISREKKLKGRGGLEDLRENLGIGEEFKRSEVRIRKN